MNAQVPAVVEKHLDGVKALKNDKLILASSNLTGRYWNGSIFWFDSIDDAPNIEKCLAGIETASGISNICCVNEDKVITSLDDGSLELHEMVDGSVPHFNTLFHSCEHDDIVSSITVNCNGLKLVSSGYDKCIKIWDLESFTSVATYRPVHAGIVWQVDCSSTEPDLLVSCGQDRKVLLLDTRLPKPIISSKLSPVTPTAISWKPLSESTFAVGFEDGSIAVQDIRNLENALLISSHSRRIHRLCFSHKNPNLLASCADETAVFVTDIGAGSPKAEYSSDAHSDFVRGLTWTDDNHLVTCGWDKNVIKHAIVATEMDTTSAPICNSGDVPNDSPSV